jgi:hypothetical protein
MIRISPIINPIISDILKPFTGPQVQDTQAKKTDGNYDIDNITTVPTLLK